MNTTYVSVDSGLGEYTIVHPYVGCLGSCNGVYAAERRSEFFFSQNENNTVTFCTIAIKYFERLFCSFATFGMNNSL